MKPMLRETLKAGLLLGAVAALAVAVLAGVQWATHEKIAATSWQTQAQQQALDLVLPADRYDNRPLTDVITVQAPRWLGDDKPHPVQRARRKGKDAALILETIAPDGYRGPIQLLVAVNNDGSVSGVRVTAHDETPDLGGLIDAAKSDWITRFAGRSLGNTPLERWAVRRDGGDFDQFAGATVTPRAVIEAVSRTLQLVGAHGTQMYAAPAGARLKFDDAPERTTRRP